MRTLTLLALLAGCSANYELEAASQPLQPEPARPEVEVPSEPAQHAPQIATARVSEDAPTEDSVLTCELTGVRDRDGDQVDVSILWQVEGVEVARDTELDGTWFDKGDEIRCVAIPSDGELEGTAVASPPVVVGNTPPEVVQVTLWPEDPREGEDVACQAWAVDPDPDTVLITYAWLVDDAIVTLSQDEVAVLDGSYVTAGAHLRCVATPVDMDEVGITWSAEAKTVTP